jgi:protein transport protein SEC24
MPPKQQMGGSHSAPTSAASVSSAAYGPWSDPSLLSSASASPHPPSFVEPGQHSQFRASPVPSDITASSSHHNNIDAASPNPSLQQFAPPPPVPAPMPPPVLQQQIPSELPNRLPSTGTFPTKMTSNDSLPHPPPNPHYLIHRGPHQPPPLPLPPPPPPPTSTPAYSAQSNDPNYGITSQPRLSRPVAPVPDFSSTPSTNRPDFAPKAGPGRPAPAPIVPRQGNPPQAQRPHLDPAQLPRPPLVTAPQHVDGCVPVYETRQSLEGMVPPPADTRFVVLDNPGTTSNSTNASPLLMRPTMYCVPQHRGIWHETGDVPFAVLCSPLALHSDDYVPPPRILPDGRAEEWRDRQRVPVTPKGEDDESRGGPARCPSCQAYATPFPPDGSGGCALCGHRGSRNMSLSTPYSTVEYEVDGPYETRSQPVRPVFLYAVDVTSPCAIDYVPVLERAAADLRFHWQRQPQTTTQAPVSSGLGDASEAVVADKQTAMPRIGVCLFSAKGVVVRSFHGKGHFAVASDVTEDPFCPLPLNDWTIDVSTESGLREFIAYVTEQLSHDIKYWKDQLKGGNAYGLDNFDLTVLGAALQFLANSLSESGGQGTVLSWRRPNFGVGKLSHREDRKVSDTGKTEDYTSYSPVQLLSKFKTPGDEQAAQFYRRLGGECAANRVALDIIMHCDPSMGHTFLDLATLGELCRMTSGRLLWIPVSQTWQSTLQEELRRQVQGFAGTDAVFKLRTSAGIQAKAFVCNPGVVQESMLGSQELELSHVSPGTSIAVELDYRVGGIPKGNKHVFLQSALLYTTVHGRRRVRVSTLALPVSSVARDVFRSVDFSATAAMMMRVNASRLHEIPSEENMTPPRANARAAVYHECLHILSSHRLVSGAGATDQIVLPETLHLLPLFVMSLMKSPLLRPTLVMNPTPRPGAAPRDAGSASVVIRPSADERAYFLLYASQASPTTAMLLAYPRLYPLDAVDSAGVGDWVESPGGPEAASGFVYLPHPFRPSMEELQEDGVYLIDNGLRYYLWMGKLVPDHVRQQARSVPLRDWNPVAAGVKWQLDAYNNSDRGHISEARPVQPPLLLALPLDGNVQSPIESMVLDLMIEDAIGGEKDYQEFFLRTHASIRNRINAQQ